MENIAWKIIKWVGNCILKIIEWWMKYKDNVDKNTFNFIQANNYYIKKAHNPIDVIEVCSINEEKNQLEEISMQKYKNLSSNDRYNIDTLLARRDYS